MATAALALEVPAQQPQMRVLKWGWGVTLSAGPVQGTGDWVSVSPPPFSAQAWVAALGPTRRMGRLRVAGHDAGSQLAAG